MTLKPGIKLISETEGSGVETKKGDSVKVLLNGWLNKGEIIQSEFTCEVVLGARNVIPGIEYSIEGMKVGGKRKVKLSPHLGYGEKGVPGKIPSNAVLVYEIEVEGIESST
ncbi:MAG: FKBP-type peptidyl-prolyl cis-trans isomerase [Candidatus Thiodiazotropha sp. (ex Myrtea sp. 'scaly one' KF741663)]|nr:FKBP-type peptidyl-prolyl cis-trans isomerase [Candidatus Thiodiazotropha sp. (ex Myrtea sp. 'scaly one' KF741663)]